MQSIKKLITTITCLVCVIFCTGCNSYKGYLGQHPALFTVAINSILGTRGAIISEILHQPVLELLETDQHGRQMFCYSEAYDQGAVSLVVCQKFDKNYVYFYPNHNFISQEREPSNLINIYGSKKQATIENPKNNFTQEEIINLKKNNDWDKELDESKCIKIEISSKKKDGPLKYEQMKDLCEKIVADTGNSGSQRDVYFFTNDNYGRSIYLIYGKYTENINERFSAVLLFNSDGSYSEETCVMELKDKYNYQEKLKQFKELNNWNSPI